MDIEKEFKEILKIESREFGINAFVEAIYQDPRYIKAITPTIKIYDMVYRLKTLRKSNHKLRRENRSLKDKYEKLHNIMSQHKID